MKNILFFISSLILLTTITGCSDAESAASSKVGRTPKSDMSHNKVNGPQIAIMENDSSVDFKKRDSSIKVNLDKNFHQLLIDIKKDEFARSLNNGHGIKRNITYRFFDNKTEAPFDLSGFSDDVLYTDSLLFAESISEYIVAPSASPNHYFPEISFYYENEKHLEALLKNEPYEAVMGHQATNDLLKYDRLEQINFEKIVVDSNRLFFKTVASYIDNFSSSKINNVKIYSNFELIRHLIIKVEQRKDYELQEVLVMDGANIPNLYIKSINHIQGGEFLSNIDVVNPIDGKTIRKLEFQADLYVKNQEYDPQESSTVVFCDTGTLNIPSKKILTGPYLNDSYYGWVESPQDIASNLDGAYNLDYRGLTSSSHLETIISSSYQHPNLISASLKSCFQNKFLTTVKNHGVRVANISMGHNLEKNNCEKYGFEKALAKHKDILWVFAAGNDMANFDVTNNYVCPQNLSLSHTNKLIVSTDKHLYTNKGSNYSDFIVKEKSTSKAAVKVSSDAAELISLYPDLTNDEIRQAMILSTDKSWNHSIPTRTMGTYNFYKAKEFAGMISQGMELYNIYSAHGDHGCGHFNKNKCVNESLTRFKSYKFEVIK